MFTALGLMCCFRISVYVCCLRLGDGFALRGFGLVVGLRLRFTICFFVSVCAFCFYSVGFGY